MVTRPVEVMRPGTSPSDWQQQDLRTQAVDPTVHSRLQGPARSMGEPLKVDNTLNLTAGQFPRMTLGLNTRVMGVPGTLIAGADLSGSGTSLSGIRFTAAVALRASARVVFTDCQFDHGVTMATGARASYLGCVFANNSSVVNSGLAADSGIVGCMRGTTAHTNCSIIYENTF